MNIIHPKIFGNSSEVTAVFTEANRSLFSPDDSIQGLDLGINTPSTQAERDSNYKSLFEFLNIDNQSLALANQVHGSAIEIVSKVGIYENTDGLITDKTGLALGIQVADCAAILIADEVNQVIGAFHAGWRGAVADIIPKGLHKMKSLGAEIEKMKAFISPCISQKKFEVGEEVASQFPDTFVDQSSFQKPHVDLKAFLANQLAKAGMKLTQIEVSTGCTMENTRFFSYRREREKAGRMLGLIRLTDK